MTSRDTIPAPATVFPVQVPLDFAPTDSQGDGEDLRWDGKPCPCQEPPYRPSFGGGFRAPRGKFIHGAVDIMAAEGCLVVAPCDGIIPEIVPRMKMDGVVADQPGAGTKVKAGHYFFLVSEDGHWRWYGSHLRDAPLVEPGTRVRAGDLLGYVGRTGNAVRRTRSGLRGCPHLHLGLTALRQDVLRDVRRAGVDFQGRKVDPVPFLHPLWEDGGWRA